MGMIATTTTTTTIDQQPNFVLQMIDLISRAINCVPDAQSMFMLECQHPQLETLPAGIDCAVDKKLFREVPLWLSGICVFGSLHPMMLQIMRR